MLRATDLYRPWGRMRVWEAGSGPALLAIHGLGGSGRYWEGLARRLAGSFRVIAPDLAGFGGSSLADGVTPDRASHLRDLEAVADNLAPDGLTWVVGHSLGGTLAALVVRARPEIAGLAIAAAPFPGDGDMDFRHVGDRASVRRRVMEATVRAAWPAIAVPIIATRRYPAAVIFDFGRQSIRGRVWTLWSVLSDPAILPELDGDASWPERVLLINAVNDRQVALSEQARWAELVPNTDRSVIDRGGHQFLLRTGFEPLVRWIGR